MRSTSVPDPIYLPLLTSLWSQWMYYVCFSTSVVLVNLSVLSLIGWLFIFAKKCDCDTINLLFVISITTILVKLLQLIWGVVTTFVVCQSVCLSYVSVYLELQLLGGASKRGGDWGLEKVKIFGCTQIYGGPQDIFWGEPEIRRKLGSLQTPCPNGDGFSYQYEILIKKKTHIPKVCLYVSFTIFKFWHKWKLYLYINA